MDTPEAPETLPEDEDMQEAVEAFEESHPAAEETDEVLENAEDVDTAENVETVENIETAEVEHEEAQEEVVDEPLVEEGLDAEPDSVPEEENSFKEQEQEADPIQ